MLDMVTIADRVPSLVVIAWGRVFRIPTDDLAGQLPCHCRKRWALNVWWCCAASDAEGEGYLHMSDRRYVHVGGVVSGQGKGEKGEGRLSSCHALSVRGYFRGSTPSNSAADTAPLHLVPSFPPPIARTLDALTPGPSLPPSPIALKLHTHTHTHLAFVTTSFTRLAPASPLAGVAHISPSVRLPSILVLALPPAGHQHERHQISTDS